MIDENLWNEAHQIAVVLKREGFEAYIIGGAVRDILLDRSISDFDIVTNAPIETLTKIPEFKEVYADNSKNFGVVKLKLENGQHIFDVATLRKDIEAYLGRKLTKVEPANLEQDLERRDFTINALALDLENDFVIDYLDSLTDLKEKTIKFIGDPKTRIKEDPLRILRGVRFKNGLDFKYDEKTKQAIIEAVDQGALDSISSERLFSELTKMLVNETRESAFRDMHELGILGKILPEIAELKGVEQPADYHAEGDVFEHTMLTLKSIEKADANPVLVWAALLHDVGKGVTVSLPESEEDRIRFNSHSQVGSEIAKKILTRLKASKSFIQSVSWLVHYHLITDDFALMKPSRRLYYLANPNFLLLVKLHEVDVLGSSHPGSNQEVEAQKEKRKIIEMLNDARQEADQYKDNTPSLKNTFKLDGNWIKQKFAISEGQILGKIIEKVNQAIQDNEIQTQKELEEFISKASRQD